MKRIKMAASAMVILTIVGAGLAFRSASDQPTVYCAPAPGNPGAPSATAACPSIDLVEFETTLNQGLSNPCATGQVPYQTSASSCTQYVSGTQFVAINE